MTNISISQSGIPRETQLSIGRLSSHEQTFEWENLRDVLSSNNPDYVHLFDDFLLQSQIISQKYTVTTFGSSTSAIVWPATSQLAPGEISLRAGSGANGATENGYIQIATNTAWTVGNGEIIFKCRFKLGYLPPTTPYDTKMELGVSTARAITTNGIHFEDHSEAGLTPSDNIGSNKAILIGGGDNDSGSYYGVCAYDGTAASSQDTNIEFTASRGYYHTVEMKINPIGDTHVIVDGEYEFDFLSVFDITDKVTPFFSVKNYDSGIAEPTIFIDYFSILGPR